MAPSNRLPCGDASAFPAETLPPWVVLHVPHDSSEIPVAVRDQFVLSDDDLAVEIERMTDHHTLALFAGPAPLAQVVRAPVSRLVVDVERFVRDEDEPMAKKGMGVVYALTADRRPLRRSLGRDEREALLRTWYVPHHERLEQVVAAAVATHGRCLVIDCHSFPEQPLAYEEPRPGALRPDICIGTDGFHSPEPLVREFVSAFTRAAWTVLVDAPFAGALVPASRYRRDPRVQAVMVEVNRRLYLADPGGRRRPDFAVVAGRVQACCAAAIARLATAGG